MAIELAADAYFAVEDSDIPTLEGKYPVHKLPIIKTKVLKAF